MATAKASKAGNFVVDPRGHVILVVGVTPLQQGIQVSSHVLSLASTVFKVMFGPHFQEGQRIKAIPEDKVTIPLPDDDPEAASLACRILHNKIDNTLENPNLKLVAKLAIFGDKYDCVQSLRPSTQRWIQNLQSGISCAGYEDLLALSYQLDDPELFQKLTMNMALEHSGSFLTFLRDYGRDLLPVSLASKCIPASAVAIKVTKGSGTRRKENKAACSRVQCRGECDGSILSLSILRITQLSHCRESQRIVSHWGIPNEIYKQCGHDIPADSELQDEASDQSLRFRL
ncbi:MAG: hypothetical protein LQ347_004248 [Umbilicaria vellea]|nr:MAG: hypothetical protein LQ347_004248 [Umbilicaria vellea]